MQHMQGASEAGNTPAQVVGGYLTQALPGTTSANFTAPSGSSTSFTLICAAACGAAENTTTINAATTTKTYVYEPIDTNGNVCTDGGCVRFNLYYRLEKDNSLQTIRSEHQ
jgi:hypothetical protein